MCNKHSFFFFFFFCIALLQEFSENPCFVFQHCFWQQWSQTLSLVAIHFEEGSNGTRLHIMISLHLNPPATVVAWLGFYTGKPALCTSQVVFPFCMRRWVPIRGQQTLWTDSQIPQEVIMRVSAQPLEKVHWGQRKQPCSHSKRRRDSTQHWQSGRNGLNQSEDFVRIKKACCQQVGPLSNFAISQFRLTISTVTAY